MLSRASPISLVDATLGGTRPITNPESHLYELAMQHMNTWITGNDLFSVRATGVLDKSYGDSAPHTLRYCATVVPIPPLAVSELVHLSGTDDLHKPHRVPFTLNGMQFQLFVSVVQGTQTGDAPPKKSVMLSFYHKPGLAGSPRPDIASQKDLSVMFACPYKIYDTLQRSESTLTLLHASLGARTHQQLCTIDDYPENQPLLVPIIMVFPTEDVSSMEFQTCRGTVSHLFSSCSTVRSMHLDLTSNQAPTASR